MLRPLTSWLLLCSALVGQTPTRQTPAPPTVQQTVAVSADRLAGINDSAASVAVLNAQQLESPPGLALDDRLHSIAGFQLFRRTSSWTANPTSQGLSLRYSFNR